MWHEWIANINKWGLELVAYYKLQISEYSDFSELVVNKMVEGVTEAEFGELEYNTTYYWRVKNIDNQTGSESAWSTVCVFTTVPADIIIDKTVSSASGGSIVFMVGSTVIDGPWTSCDIPDGKLGTCLSVSGTYTGKLGTSDCLVNCQQWE